MSTDRGTAWALAAVFAATAVVACGSSGSGSASTAGTGGQGAGQNPFSGGAGSGARSTVDAATGNGGIGGSGGGTVPGGTGGTGSVNGGGSGGVSNAGGVNDGGVGNAGGTNGGGASNTGGTNAGGTSDGGAPGDGSGGAATCTVAPGSTIGVFIDPVTATPVVPPNPPGIAFIDTDGKPVDAHGGGIIKECDTFYLHGEYFLSTTTNNDFNGFSMYSSKDLATWKNEGIILPQQPNGQLGPSRKGERPHIIKCPATGEFVLYAHSADETYQADKEVVYATSSTVNATYMFQGSLLSGTGAIAAHSDMSALTDGANAYVVTESGWVYTLASDCHSWVSAKQYGAVNGTTGGSEAPTVFKAGNTFYWIGSDKTGWRANDDFYSTAPAMTGPWTYRGYVAPEGAKTWMTQTTWVEAVIGSQGTVYVFWGDHWDGDQDTTAPGKHNDRTTFVFQPLVFDGTAISMPAYNVTWKLDVGAGTWSP